MDAAKRTATQRPDRAFASSAPWLILAVDDDPEMQKLDGTPIVGRCSDDGFEQGRWYCLVRDGKANLNGIIVD